jgi:hypothetical protein
MEISWASKPGGGIVGSSRGIFQDCVILLFLNFQNG